MTSTKLRNSAKGQTCTFRIPGICNHDPETTVLCHGPDPIRGKAMKTEDYWAAYGCSACHYALDHHQVEQREQYWLYGILETQKRMQESGLLIIPLDAKRPKKSTKRAVGQPRLMREHGAR